MGFITIALLLNKDIGKIRKSLGPSPADKKYLNYSDLKKLDNAFENSEMDLLIKRCLRYYKISFFLLVLAASVYLIKILS